MNNSNPVTLPIIVNVCPTSASGKKTNYMPVGRIEYLHTNGQVREDVEYAIPELFVKDIKKECYYGTPVNIVLYRDKYGNNIPRSSLRGLDSSSVHIKIIDSPYTSKKLLDMAKESIRDYMRSEFPEDEDGADFSNIFSIPVAYTTTEDDKHEIQTYVNLVKRQIITHLDGQAVRIEQYPNLWAMTKYGLDGMSFEELVSIPDEVLEAVS